MKRFSSGLAVVLGLLGLLLSIALILGMWIFNSRINKSIASLITPVETVVTSVDDRVLALDTKVQTLQDDVIADLLAKTNAVKTSPPDMEIDTSPIIEGIEGRLEPAINNLTGELASLEPQIKTTVQLLSIAKSFLPQDAQTIIESKVSEQVTTTSANLAATQAKLQQRKADLSSITVNTDIKRMEAIEEPIQELNTRLANVDTLLQGLGTNIGDVQNTLVKSKRRIGLYSILATLGITLLSLWTLWAQLALFKSGRRGFRGVK